MKTILLFGAGKSSSVLIEYLLRQAPQHGFSLRVIDADVSLANTKVGGASHGSALGFDIMDTALREPEIERADLVISLLPPQLHQVVAVDCLRLKKHLLTASYVNEELQAMKCEIASNNLLFLCEMGLDPGIDHMSAMALLNDITQRGGMVHSFVSHCGGLVAPESDTNPWHYKISWNPRNVVTAGQAGALYRLQGKEIRLSYEQLFERENTVEVAGLGRYAWYPNRDSLSYLSLYGLQRVDTFIRTTLRHPDFIKGWKNLLQLSLTHDEPSYSLPNATLSEAFAHHFAKSGVETKVTQLREKDPLFDTQLQFLGADADKTPLGTSVFTPALLLQRALEKKLLLQEGDRDMIVMLHEIGYSIAGEKREVISQLVVKGEDQVRTAMAKTVGLPLAMAAILLLQNKITLRGLQIPTHREIYEPVMLALKNEGIVFSETDRPVESR
ncbi:MAG: saccharopine dehydrogenase [Chitinophagales bacterium]|jgi:saccharopine dehydrogenase (NADP+, L-glutamate forming)|nr:saccharopine dehydrogenase [Chitinophagales bacterium]